MDKPHSFEKSRFSIELDVVGPLMTRSVEARHFSEDLLGLTVDGRPALPGSLIKGVLRSALREMLEALADDTTGAHDKLASLLHRCFGPAVAPAVLDPDRAPAGSDAGDQSWEPDRGMLNFEAYWLAGPEECSSATLSRIRIDSESGTVEPGALVVARSPLQPGQRATFRGDVETWLPPIDVEEIQRWLAKAVQLIHAVGGSTSVGFGEVTEIRISKRESTPVPGSNNGADSSDTTQDLRFGLSLRLDRPFCFARPHGRGNVLESHPYIPGGAIIGAVAETLAAQDSRFLDELKNNLHAIHVTHAHPANCAKGARSTDFRASPIPLSVAVTDDGPVDLARASVDGGLMPAFSADWKAAQRAKVEQALPEAEATAIRRIAIVRNAIHPETGAAAESALFAFDAIDPSEREWRCNVTIDAEAVEDGTDPKRVLDRFRQLVELGILGLGKTKARAAVEIREPWRQAFAPGDGPEQQVKPGGTLRMLLVTDADLLGAVAELPSTGGAPALHKLYQQYFDRQFGDKRLELQQWFTTEVLAGGRYIHRRFWSSGSNKAESGEKETRAAYRPHVMTGAGSLFVFGISEDLDEESLRGLRSDLQCASSLGLTPGPILRESKDRQADPRHAWKHHPWLRAQGYGEILLQPNLGLLNSSEASNAHD